MTTIQANATKLVKRVAREQKMKFSKEDVQKLSRYAAKVMGNPITPEDEVEGVVLTMMKIILEDSVKCQP